MSIGEDRVRVKFNPSAETVVDQIKQKTAELINICNERNNFNAVPPLSTEEARLWIIAQQTYEEAAMWAVKAATGKQI